MRDTASVISIHEPGALALVRSLLRQGVSVRIRVSGDSMQPLLKGGELVEIAPLTGTLPQLGEIIFLFDQQGSPLIHRLIWRRSQNGAPHLLTKGDACVCFDGFIPAEQAAGRVLRILSDNGEIADLRRPQERLRAALIVCRALFGHALRKIAARL
ncbi:S24/S26 family peptidase [Candidatus Electronema sp. TJ]|uniref:S24/S26 family peptidase n=1 Tax=Candidatus Electronema sp. TJ TaxID=3401573 RepID=UPI003AA9B064